MITEPDRLELIDPRFEWLGCNVDGLFRREYKGKRVIVEAKTSSLQAGWGDPGTNEVPAHVNCQVQHNMSVYGADAAVIPVLTVSHGRLCTCWYWVEEDVELQELLFQACKTFWFDHVLKDIPPKAVNVAMETVKRMHRDPGLVAKADPDMAERLRLAMDTANAATKYAKALKATFLYLHPDAEVLIPGVQYNPGEAFEFTFTRNKKPTTHYGKGPEYGGHCPHCKVGKKESHPRVFRKRKLQTALPEPEQQQQIEEVSNEQ